MKRQARLRGVEGMLQLAYAAFAMGEQRDDLEARRVRQGVKPPAGRVDSGQEGRSHGPEVISTNVDTSTVGGWSRRPRRPRACTHRPQERRHYPLRPPASELEDPLDR